MTAELPRKLGVVDAASIVVGIVIGSGIFLLPNLIARKLPSAPAIIAVWIVAGVLSYFGALAYAELGAMMPATGGQYVFLREAYGPASAFLSGWVFLFCAVPGGIAFLAVAFSIYLGNFFALGPGARTAASLLLVAILSLANYLGATPAAWIQRVFTFLKIAGVLFIIGAAVIVHRAAPAPQVSTWSFSYSGIGFAMTACLLAYNGWSYVTFVAGEVKNPARNLPRALVLGMVAVIALYVLANIAYMHVMTVGEVAASERVGADVASRALGSTGAAVLSAIVLLSIVGAINGVILTGARIAFAQARDGLFFSVFGRVSPRFQTPTYGIALQAVWSGVLIVSGSYATLASYSIIAAWMFYTLTVSAVARLRKIAPDAPRPYRMWGYPGSMWAFVIVSVWFLADALVNQPRTTLASFAIIAVGALFYLLFRRTGAEADAARLAASGKPV